MTKITVPAFEIDVEGPNKEGRYALFPYPAYRKSDWKSIAEHPDARPQERATARAVLAYIEEQELKPWALAKQGDVVDVKIEGEWFRGLVNERADIVLSEQAPAPIYGMIELDNETETSMIEDSNIVLAKEEW